MSIGHRSSTRTARRKTGVVDGVRTKLLWIIVAAIAVSGWLPIELGQRDPGIIPVAQAAVVGSYDVSGGGIGRAGGGGTLFTALSDIDGLAGLKPAVQAIDGSSDVQNTKGPTMTVSVSWANQLSKADDTVKVTALVPAGIVPTLTGTITCAAQFKLAGYSVYVLQGDGTSQVAGTTPKPIPVGTTKTSVSVPINDTTFPGSKAMQTFQIKVVARYVWDKYDPSQPDTSCGGLLNGITSGLRNWDFQMKSDAQTVTIDHQGNIHAASDDPNFNPSSGNNQQCGAPDGITNNISLSEHPLDSIMCTFYVGIAQDIRFLYNMTLKTYFIPWLTSKSAMAEHLTNGQLSDGSPAEFGANQWGRDIYAIALNLVNYVIVLVLLFLSFVNILHINIDTYGVKKVIPTLIYGVILANFGLFITRTIVDLADVLLATFSQAAPLSDGLANIVTPIATTGLAGFGLAGLLSGGALLPLAGIAMLIIFLLPFLLIGAISILMTVRYYVVILLAAVSPLAFVGMALPMTQSYFKQWWDNLLKWTFMAPVTYLFLYLAAAIGAGSIKLGGSVFEQWIASCILLYLAIQMPFTLGGSIMSNWGGLLKKAGLRAAKTSDKWLGDATKRFAGGRPMNFQGIYQGWKERSEEREHEQLGEAKAFGRAGSEAWSRGWSALLNQQNPLKGAKEAYSLETSRSQNLVVQNKRKKAEENFQAFEGMKDDDTLKKELKQAIGSGDYEAAETYMMVAARRGILDEQSQRDFIAAFQQGHGAEVAAVDSLIPELNRKAEAPEDLRASILHLKNGKYEVKSNDQIQKDRLKEIDKFASSRGRTATQTFVKRLMFEEKLVDRQGRATDFDKLNSNQRALFAKLRGLGEYNLDTEACQVLLHVKNPEVKFDTSNFNFGDAIPENQKVSIQQSIQKHLNDAGSLAGMQFATPEARQAAATTVHAHWDQIVDTMRQKDAELMGKLPEPIRQKAAANGNLGFDQLKASLTADDHRALEANDDVRDAWAQFGQLNRAGSALQELRAEHATHVDSSMEGIQNELFRNFGNQAAGPQP